MPVTFCMSGRRERGELGGILAGGRRVGVAVGTTVKTFHESKAAKLCTQLQGCWPAVQEEVMQ